MDNAKILNRLNAAEKILRSIKEEITTQNEPKKSKVKQNRYANDPYKTRK